MKVTAVRFVDAAGPVRPESARVPALPDDRLFLLELQTDEGLAGIAIIPSAARSAAERVVEDLLVATDPRAATGAWQRMSEAAATCRTGFQSQAAMAALDIALWDLKAKLNGEPLWKTLGGGRPRANIHASEPRPSGDPHTVSNWAAQMAQKCGIHAAKIYLPADTRADEARLDAMLTAFGEAAPATFAVDLGRGTTPKATIRRVRALEKRFDIAWLEGAAPDTDLRGLKQVSDAVRAAVSVGRRFGLTSEFLPHFQHRSADIIDLDIGRTGITGALLLADAAYGYELPVTLAATHGNLAAHLAPVMPYFMSLEIVDPESASTLYRSDVRIEQGRAVAGDAHGHGMCAARAVAPAGESS